MSRRAWHVSRLLRVLLPAVLIALLVLAIHRLDLAQVALALGAARPLWVLLTLLCYVLILPLWALQWTLLAPATAKVSPARMLGVVSMTSTILNTTPALAGEAAAVVFLVTRAGLRRAAAVAVLAMDQLLVGLAKLVILAGAAATVALPTWMARAATTLAVGVVALLSGLLTFAWQGKTLPPAEGHALAHRIAHSIGRLGFALDALRAPTRGGTALLLAFAKKFVELLAILCMQQAFGLSLPATSALLILASLNLATLLPLVPGNVGVFEGAVVLAYAYFGIDAERALGLAIAQHACYFAALAVPGYVWLMRAVPRRSATAAP